jgi:uncharacterized protein
MNSKNVSRLLVVDALRGFAIVSIMLLHNFEHFDFSYSPTNLPAWMLPIDKGIGDTLFFLFGGKSYAIFALLFGLTFFIQFDNQEKKGKDFRARFAWRLVILLAFAFVNSAFYEGDILAIYAILGFFLIPVAKLNTKTVFWIALFLMLQPVEWVKFFIGVQNPGMHVSNPASWAYFGRAGEYIPKNSLINTWIGNLTNGKMATINWSWEQGRILQNISLFMFGMLAGRKYLFVPSVENKRFWIKTLMIAAVMFIILFIIRDDLGQWISSNAIRRPMRTIVSSYTNMAFMLILVSGFVLLFQTGFFHKVLNVFSPLGRMSLSNYIMQSIAGSFIYFGFGLGLYQYTGGTYCLLIGIVLAVLQGHFSSWWMKNHKQGPLETIWHKATWVGSK